MVPEYAQRLHLQAVKGHDAWDLLPTIHAPTLVMHGSDDQRVPTANAYLLAGRIPGAQLSIIPGGRHGFLVEKRAGTSRLVNEFQACHPLS
jgi:pimeloyl-ACP methyl ester carboxylesterase